MPYANTPSGDNLLLGKGQVFFKRRVDAGVSSGYRHLGNVETFELTTEDDLLEKYSSMSAAAPLLKSVNRRRTVTLNLTADEFHPENVAMALMGETATQAAQAATPVVAEVMTTDVLLGGFYMTALLGPITAVSLDNSTTPTALVAGTDYVIHDADVGIIQILSTATNISDGDSLTIDYTPTAYASGWATVNGGSAGTIEGEVLFIGDPTTGPAVRVQVWSVSVSPNGAIGLISEEFAQMGLTMKVQDDSTNHPDNPLYKVDYLP